MSSDDDSVKEEEEVHDDISNPDILSKYRAAADIANLTLKGVIMQCVEGKDIAKICTFGDSVITQQCSKSFKKKKSMEKGIAFPTCISVNDCICNFSPLPNESKTLKNGDLVKIDLGCHIDGYIATVAHSLVVGEESVTGEKADVLAAAYTGLQVAWKSCRAGAKGSELTTALMKVAEDFGVKGLTGTLSHKMKRFMIDGGDCVNQVDDPDTKVEEVEFAVGDVYQLDVCMSTGAGKAREGEDRCTVHKRAMDQSYRLRMKASRYVINAINKNFATLPFTIRALDDEKQARMGVVECVNHELLEPYKVLFDKAGSDALVARFKATIVITKNGTTMITNPQLADGVTSEKKVSEEIQAILSRSASTKKKRGKKKRRKKKAAGAGAGSGEGEGDAAGAGADA